MQEVFLRFFIERSDGRAVANPRAWLCRMLLNYVLDPREWECLALRCAGMEYAEIGRTMGLRVGTVGALLARASRRIREAAVCPAMAEAIRTFVLGAFDAPSGSC